MYELTLTESCVATLALCAIVGAIRACAGVIRACGRAIAQYVYPRW